MQSQDTYLMPVSPASGRRATAAADSVPAVKKAQGHVPACLVNASLTYCGNDRIYAFGGFDQYTDEGMAAMIVDLDSSDLASFPCKVRELICFLGPSV